MKGAILFIVAIITVFSSDAFAGNKRYKKSSSNIYQSKKYKGHSCPKPRKIINAVYF